MEQMRKIKPFRNHYLDFYLEQPLKVRDKINYVLRIVKMAPKIPKKFLDHIPVRMVYMKSEWSSEAMFTVFSVVSIKKALSFCLMRIKRKHKKQIRTR